MSSGRAQTIGELEAPEQLYKRDSVLFAAASRGQTELIRSLIARGEHVDWADAHGQTPLWAAAWNGHADACAVLLDHSPNLRLHYTSHPSKHSDLHL